MTILQLPYIPYDVDIIKTIKIVNTPIELMQNNICNIKVNKTLYVYLTRVKSQIDGRHNEWDKYKKYTNPYEFIHTCVPGTKFSISCLKPLSRSFYKMVEIYNLMNFETFFRENLSIFYIAEGPGGFIEALVHLRNAQRKSSNKDKHYAISLIDKSDPTIPGWSRSKEFVKKNKNITIETGVDGTGNIFNPDTYKDIYNKYNNTMDFVTGDGGFNFSNDFNKQEQCSSKLILCQIAYIFAVQKYNGDSVIKFFDTFTDLSIDLTYLLMLAYKSVSWVKPVTSRYANSEKYACCKGFRIENRDQIINCFTKILEKFYKNKTTDIYRIFACPIPYTIITKITEYNAILGQQQIESIVNTLTLVDSNKNDKLDSIKKNNVTRCISWCSKYNIPYNKNISINTFITNSTVL